MNRPNIKNYKYEECSRYIKVEELVKYNGDLEKYCNELEQEVNNLRRAQSLEAVLKLDNALNEACKILSMVEMDDGWYCPYTKFDSVSCKCCDDLKCHDPEAIKKYLLTKE